MIEVRPEQSSHHITEISRLLEVTARERLQYLVIALDRILGALILELELADAVIGFQLVQQHCDPRCDLLAPKRQHPRLHARCRPPAALAHGELPQAALPADELLAQQLCCLLEFSTTLCGLRSGNSVYLPQEEMYQLQPIFGEPPGFVKRQRNRPEA